jgi:hypothetical protein
MSKLSGEIVFQPYEGNNHEEVREYLRDQSDKLNKLHAHVARALAKVGTTIVRTGGGGGGGGSPVPPASSLIVKNSDGSVTVSPTTTLIFNNDGGFVVANLGSGEAEVNLSYFVLATEDLPAYTVITSAGVVANSATVNHRGKVIGITRAAIANGFTGNYASDGFEIENPAWAWTAGDILYLNGTSLSTVSPSTGFTQKIATAKSSIRVLVELDVPVLL